MIVRRPRVLFFDGPGDLVGAFRHWRTGRAYPGEVAATYSSQFFAVAERLGLQAHAVAWPPRRARLVDGDFVIEQRPRPLPGARGAAFHAAQLVWAADLLALAARFRPDVTMLVDTPYPFLFAPLRALGSRVVVALHNTLWPAGHPRADLVGRGLARANGWFFRRHVDATLALSPECERQVRAVAGAMRGPVIQYRPRFEGRIAAAPQRLPGAPLRVLFASRIERSKGVLDLLEVAARLHARRPGRFRWTICGGGAAAEEVAQEIGRRGLAEVVLQRPRLSRAELLQEYARCDVVMVPTAATFAEGLAKVALEAVLAGRPVVVSDSVPAGEILGDAALVAPAGDVDAFARALERLADDPDFFRATCAAAEDAAGALLRDDGSFEAVVEHVLRELLDLRLAPCRGGTRSVAGSGGDEPARSSPGGVGPCRPGS